MPKLSLADDPFASVTEDAGRCRKPSSLLLLLLLPVLGLAGMVFGMQASFPTGCLSRAADGADIPNECAAKAKQLREIEIARRHVVYWTLRTRGPGVVTASDWAKLRDWKRGYQRRRALFARM